MKAANRVLLLVFCAALGVGCASAQSKALRVPLEQDASGTYGFLEEGEFVQLDIQDAKVGGFVSRFGHSDADKGTFLDHFMKEGSLRGRDLTFETQTVHGIWYGFKGRIERGDARTKSQEGYYVLRGTLTEYATDADKKMTSRQREVTFKMFPEEEQEPAETPAEKTAPSKTPPPKKSPPTN